MTYVLQHVVFPLERDPDLLPLYVDPEVWSTVRNEPVRVSDAAHVADVLDRHAFRVRAGQRVSFASYFNAFPASYWQHWTSVREVQLSIRTSGRATVLVYRSNGGGVRQRILSQEVDADAVTALDIPLDRYSDGGWIWFDIVADTEDVRLEHATWSTEAEPVRTGKASLGITTFNKPEYCVETLSNLAASPELLELIDKVMVIDQGTDLVQDRPAFPEVEAALGSSLRIIRQPNLGGSGGFARAMLETLELPDSDFVQLLDDDVMIEPESIRRSIVFGRFATQPTIVGAHMFDLLDRSKLHAWAEVVDDHPFMWRNLFQEVMPHDFSKSNIRQSPILHMRLDADYNGWWMCLIPVEVIRKIGLSLPAFIKWDDAEYCLRARDAGFPTVSVPGVALWHVSWVGKDDSIDWQAYFHCRNRIVAALLHSRTPRGGTLIRHSRRIDLKHLMMMQYYPVALRIRALKDVLSGPEHMWPSLPEAMPAARRLAADFPETVTHKEAGSPLRARRGRQVYGRAAKSGHETPTGLRLRWFTLVVLLTHWFHDARPENVAQPEVEFGKGDANWWRIPLFDSALVNAADGSGKNVYTRNRRQYRRMLIATIVLHRRLQRSWPQLSKRYRDAQASLTSREAWAAEFGRAE